MLRLLLICLLALAGTSLAGDVLYFTGKVQSLHPEGVIVRCDGWKPQFNSGHSREEVTGSFFLTAYPQAGTQPGALIEFRGTPAGIYAQRKAYDGGALRKVIFAPR